MYWLTWIYYVTKLLIIYYKLIEQKFSFNCVTNIAQYMSNIWRTDLYLQYIYLNVIKQTFIALTKFVKVSIFSHTCGYMSIMSFMITTFMFLYTNIWVWLKFDRVGMLFQIFSFLGPSPVIPIILNNIILYV